MKKIVFGGIALLAVVTLGACSSGSAKSTTENASTTQTTEADLTDEQFFDELVSKLEPVTTDNYNSGDYNLYDYKTLLRNPVDVFGLKTKIINFEILQVSKDGKYTKLLGTTPNSDFYMVIIETKRLEHNLLKDDTLTINGRSALVYDYTSVSGTSETVPLIYTDAYVLYNN